MVFVYDRGRSGNDGQFAFPLNSFTSPEGLGEVTVGDLSHCDRISALDSDLISRIVVKSFKIRIVFSSPCKLRSNDPPLP